MKREQRHRVKSHHVKDSFVIFLQNSSISEMCFLLPNYRKRKAPLGSRKQRTEHIYLRHIQEGEMRNSIRKKSAPRRKNLMYRKNIRFVLLFAQVLDGRSCNCENDHYLAAIISFDCVSTPPPDTF